MKPSGVPRGGGQRGRFAPGGTLRGAAKKGKKKKEKRREKEKRKKKKKRKKREKKKIWEKHVITVKLNWNILAAAPLCTYNLTFWRPYPFWRGRVVGLYVLLHGAPNCIGPSGAPTTQKHVY